jgi:hypothetical protein
MGLVDMLPKLRDMRGMCFVNDMSVKRMYDSNMRPDLGYIRGSSCVDGYYGDG